MTNPPKNSQHADGQKGVDAFQLLPWPDGTTIVPGKPAGRGTKPIADCTVTFLSGESVPVEVKYGSAAQVRPLDYRVLVVSDNRGEWWVVGPHDVMRLATSYSPQHALNPFECFSAGGPPPQWWSQWKCSPSEVPTKVLSAHLSGSQSPMRDLATTFRKEIADLRESMTTRVNGAHETPPSSDPAPLGAPPLPR